MPSHPDESAALAIQTPAINDRSLAAGLAYAMGSRVSGISFDAATGLMLGKVRGGADAPYSTTAKLVRKAGGWSCTVGVCSCPVRKDCKHVAALLFSAEDSPAIRVQLLAPADVSRLSRQVPALEVPDWEQALSPLIAQPGITPSTNGIPLALQFEIEEPAPHFSYTGRRDPLRSVRQLKARPVIMGAKGKWIRGDVSWNTLSYLSYRRECNEAHVEWMQEFLAAHTAQANRQHAGTGLWLGLNTYAGKNLWSLLAQARKVGVALVHSRGSEPVRLVEQPAAVGLNLTRYGTAPVPAEAADDGGLSLAPTITVEGDVVDPASVGTIGRPAHGIFLTSGADALPGIAPGDSIITLAPLESGLSEELLTFVTAGTTLHIPARDESRFLTGFYPKLKQSARVTASDESVELPQLAVPTLSLLANYGAGHRVRLHWEWHYKSGKLVTAQPLWRHPGDHGYRDDPAEARILEAVGQPWDVVPALGESATGGWGTPRLAASAELSGLDTLAFTEELLPRLREVPGVGGYRRRDRRLPRGRRGSGRIHLHQGHRAARLVRPGHRRSPWRASRCPSRPCFLGPGGRPDQDAAPQRGLLLPGPAGTAPVPRPDRRGPGTPGQQRCARCRSAASRPGSGTNWPSSASSTSRPQPGARLSAGCWKAA